MKNNTLPFISLLLIAAMLTAPFIFAFDGSFGGYDPGAWEGGSFGGYDSGAWTGGSFGGYDSGAYGGGSFAGIDSGAWTGGSNGGSTDTTETDSSDTFTDTDSATPSDTSTGSPDDNFGGSFGPGPSDYPLPPPDGGIPPGGPGGFPTNVDAVWQQLSDITIPQGSASGTIIQNNIFSKCSDADDANLEFSIKTKSENYDLSYIGNNLEIFNLKQTYTGTETVTLTCNNVPASFKLTVKPAEIATSEEDELSVHISTIRLPEQASSGEQIPITISFKNNGNEKLEDLKAAVSIQELGIRASVGPMDLSVGKRVSKTIYVELPQDVQPGTYYAKITIDSSSLHRVKYREVEIA